MHFPKSGKELLLNHKQKKKLLRSNNPKEKVVAMQIRWYSTVMQLTTLTTLLQRSLLICVMQIWNMSVREAANLLFFKLTRTIRSLVLPRLHPTLLARVDLKMSYWVRLPSSKLRLTNIWDCHLKQ